ncbi:FHA domain-containing protein PS1 [Malania oleifera]|uniref:FHA domain-containing protein PS1 n=1 Tax=Malania oleifera TaxID=397392 RepID=UPI0025AE4125|nr:FHA domain-containing protein PS1 [Malania oleifera]
MADKKSSDIGENKIPVFTVLKNNAILKNIFVINQPPPSIFGLKSIHPEENVEPQVQECDEILLVGRHPDCNIVLEHPSISRFHLRIHSKPSLQKLSVIDLSSVHGTWVSDKKIEAGVLVDLSEGDTMRLGSSSRVYKLHWLPVSRAYDLENPFVPDHFIDNEEAQEEEIFQDGNSFSVESKQIEAPSIIPQAVESEFSDENSESFVKKSTPSAPTKPQNMSVFLFEELENQCPLGKEHGRKDITSFSSTPSAPPMPQNMNSFSFEELENKSPSEKDHESKEISSFWLPPSVAEPAGTPFPETENQFFDEENHRPPSSFAQEVPSETEDPKSSTRLSEQEPDPLENLGTSLSDGVQKKESQSPLKKDHEQNEKSAHHSVQQIAESLNSTLSGRTAQFDKKNQIPDFLCAKEASSERENLESPPIRSGPKTTLPSIWLRRGKPTSVLELETSRRTGKYTAVGANAAVELLKQEDTENKSVSKALFHSLDGEEENLTPGEDDFTPNTLIMRSMKKMGKLEETKHSKSLKSPPLQVAVTPNIHLEEEMFASSNKENQTPQVLQERKSGRSISRNQGKLETEVMALKRAERVPFQSLFVNSTSKSKSEASGLRAATRSSNSVNRTKTTERISNPSCNNSVGEGKRIWNMVVDSTCLLSKESRKSLQLLQGLRGTQLIIPRIVIRELDCLKRRGSLFRRTTEVSSALKWVEECMVETNWWIHVQSSVEEGRLIAPTPPASPRSRFSDGSGGFPVGTTTSMPFSTFGSLMEIVSPTAEDHILEYALLFRRIKNVGRLVLLSNDVTLKIKAMAEGLICETPEEFRESLVNPFSERFLWADSSPRGQTWSCLDDAVLREKYNNRCSLKRPLKGAEAAKGLKLILRHNSHYGQISSVS